MGYNVAMIKIGDFKLNTRIVLAPLAGCSDLPFRLICREHGAKFCFFEMIDSNSLYYNNIRTLDIVKTLEKDNPIALQLVGADPEIMLFAADKILKRAKPVFLDINCACPAKKVIKKKAGAYLLKDTKNISAIIKKLSSSLSIPVTVKMRLGSSEADVKNAAKAAMICEESGAKALFVHGRTREQGYSGDIDYQAIKSIKDSVDIPVFGSGNIFSPELAKKMFDETLCDGICVARGAFGNPWIFTQIEDYLKDGRLPKPVSDTERKTVLKRHLSYIMKYKDMHPSSRVGFMRKVALWYLKGFPNASRFRDRITATKSYDNLVGAIDELDTA